jgi:hypothetical protein
MGNPKYHATRYVHALLVSALAMVVGCTLIFDTSRLPDDVDAALDDGALDAAVIDADPLAPDADPLAPDAMVDANLPDADPAAPDASVDARPPDATPPDASCGGDGQACCPGNTCNEWHECGGGVCSPCGGVLQSCCDPGMTCQGALACLLGTCSV